MFYLGDVANRALEINLKASLEAPIDDIRYITKLIY